MVRFDSVKWSLCAPNFEKIWFYPAIGTASPSLRRSGEPLSSWGHNGSGVRSSIFITAPSRSSSRTVISCGPTSMGNGMPPTNTRQLLVKPGVISIRMEMRISVRPGRKRRGGHVTRPTASTGSGYLNGGFRIRSSFHPLPLERRVGPAG
jgi:hypothetical protein